MHEFISMTLFEGIAAILFGLSLISQGTEPGGSILIVLALPVVLYGIVQTIVGIARALRENEPDNSKRGPGRSSKEHGPVEDSPDFAGAIVRKKLPEIEGRHVIPERPIREQHSRNNACPECGASYSLFERLTQPTMCSGCWKNRNTRSM